MKLDTGKSALFVKEDEALEPRERFCKDFDLSCFEVESAARCKCGTAAVIHEIRYYTLPVKAICPLCDHLS